MGPITSVSDLQNALQSAVALEFATIPPYLCGQWSIKNPVNQCAGLIQGVAVTEMRHLTIVANCLIAVGGSPNLAAAAPSYPAYLPDGENEFEVSLVPFGSEFLTQGMNIETPPRRRSCPRGSSA